jgi:hypothetical protein
MNEHESERNTPTPTSDPTDRKPTQALDPTAGQFAPTPTPAPASPAYGPKTPPGPTVRPLQVWIIIALLTLILIVNAAALVMQALPMSSRGAGGANFVPNQSFPGTQSQDAPTPAPGTTSDLTNDAARDIL